jgi:sugar lactone lactonase YvrE
MHGRRVICIDGDNRLVRDLPVGDEPSGLGFLPDGTPIVVLRHACVIARLGDDRRPVHADLTALCRSSNDASDFILNDMVVDAFGRAYVDKIVPRTPSDGEGNLGDELILVDTDGCGRSVAEGLCGPNGLAIAADGRTLIVAEFWRRRLLRFAINHDGSLADCATFADLGSFHPDGICIDVDEQVWVAAPREGAILRVGEGKKPEIVVANSERLPSACVFGGPQRDTLFVTSASYLPGMRASAHGFVESITTSVAGAGAP